MAADERTANLLGALCVVLGDRIDAAVREAEGLSGREAAALITLGNYAEHEPMSVLRGALGLSQPGAVRLADRLVERGLVDRRRDGLDRREVRLALTGNGRSVADAALRARGGVLVELLAALAPAERRSLVPVLEKLLARSTGDRARARATCRLCEPGVCGHPARCPVTRAADAAEAA